jgi:hypothetical protein
MFRDPKVVDIRNRILCFIKDRRLRYLDADTRNEVACRKAMQMLRNYLSGGKYPAPPDEEWEAVIDHLMKLHTTMRDHMVIMPSTTEAYRALVAALRPVCMTTWIIDHSTWAPVAESIAEFERKMDMNIEDFREAVVDLQF